MIFINRITIITGHYGSGKTEFAVNFTLNAAKTDREAYEKLAICDLDLVNPYFRSREHRELFEANGIEVHGSTYRGEITAEIPALGASVRGPLENAQYRTVLDVGGNDSGALVLRQYGKYFRQADGDAENSAPNCNVIAVVNFCRYETRSVEDALTQVRMIEDATGLHVDYIVNNTHLLRETTAETVLRGHALALELCGKLEAGTERKVELLCDCYPMNIVSLNDISDTCANPFPLELYLRPTYLDM